MFIRGTVKIKKGQTKFFRPLKSFSSNIPHNRNRLKIFWGTLTVTQKN